MKEIIAYQLIETGEHLRSLPNIMEREYGEIEDFDVVIYEPTKPLGADTSFLERFVPFNGNKPIIFTGFLERLPHQTDFLNNELLWTIISKRTLYVLRSVGEFAHKAIPIKIFDYHLQDKINTYLGIKNLTTKICNEDYVILQLMEKIDAVDTENSEFEELEPDDPIPPMINKLILREPKNGFPPVFRLADSDKFSISHFSIYLSLASKKALENSGIKGIDFIPKEGFKAEMATTTYSET